MSDRRGGANTVRVTPYPHAFAWTAGEGIEPLYGRLEADHWDAHPPDLTELVAALRHNVGHTIAARWLDAVGWERALGEVARREFAGAHRTLATPASMTNDEECELSTELPREPCLAANDVFVLEGRQERYGNKNAWLATRWSEQRPDNQRPAPSGAFSSPAPLPRHDGPVVWPSS